MLSASFKKKLPDFEVNVDFSVDNQILVLLGPSGSGKTTVLQCLAGLEEPSQGEIRLGERTLYSSKQRINLQPRVRRIGYVFQHYALFPHMTVKKNITYGIPGGCKCNKGYKLSVFDVMNMLGITHLQDRYPSRLSGGEKQRVALARALMTEPELLLLDEPLSALDYQTRSTLQKELRELQRSWQIPFVLVTHDRQEADFLGDRLLLMEF